MNAINLGVTYGGYSIRMASDRFRRVLRGFDPEQVTREIESLERELADTRETLAGVDRNLTELRLSTADQVEKAGAEANALLAEARAEATRIREQAVSDTEALRAEADDAVKNTFAELERDRVSSEAEIRERVERANAEVSRASARAEEIVQFANSQSEKLKSEANDILRAAEERAQASDGDLRQQGLDAERRAAELRDQAEAHARKVYREADRYAQAAEQRSRELQTHSEQMVREAKRRSEEIGSQAMDFAKRILGEAVEQMSQVSEEVSGQMAVVNRMRRSVTEQLERLATTEPPAASEGASLSSVETLIRDSSQAELSDAEVGESDPDTTVEDAESNDD